MHYSAHSKDKVYPILVYIVVPVQYIYHNLNFSIDIICLS